jgi:hypothetical protein
MDLGRGGRHLPASWVIAGGAAEGTPGNGQRIGHVRRDHGEREGHPDIAGAPAELGRDLRRGDRRIGRIGEGVLEVPADRSPGTPAVPARHCEPHRVPPLPPSGRPPRHLFMITQALWPAETGSWQFTGRGC